MKRIRLILAGGACLLAGAAVFANANVVTKYYYSSSPGIVGGCVNQFTGTLCTPGAVAQCKAIQGEADVWITQKEETAPVSTCVEFKRN